MNNDEIGQFVDPFVHVQAHLHTETPPECQIWSPLPSESLGRLNVELLVLEKK